MVRVEELTEQWKKALADYQNLEKRFAREKQDFVAFANSTLILKLLSVLDNLQRVESYLQDQGLQMTIDEFKRLLAEEGLEEIKTEGRDFDPEEMEAIEAKEGKDKGKVAEVLQKGYRLKSKVLRPAKVIVNR